MEYRLSKGIPSKIPLRQVTRVDLAQVCVVEASALGLGARRAPVDRVEPMPAEQGVGDADHADGLLAVAGGEIRAAVRPEVAEADGVPPGDAPGEGDIG